MEKYEKRLIINQGLGEREEQIQRFNKDDWGTWVPQNRQGKLRGCSPSVQQESTPPRLTGPSALQGLFLLLTRGADNSRPDYTALSCPNSCDLGTAE